MRRGRSDRRNDKVFMSTVKDGLTETSTIWVKELVKERH